MSDFKKRELFVVDETFQFRYSIMLGITGLIVSAITGFVFYNHVIAQDKVLLLSGLGANTDVAAFFIQQHKLLLVKIITIGVIITLFMFLAGLVLSNKLSGAVFSLRRTLNELASTGDLSLRFRIRDNDELQEFTDDLNKAMERLEFDYGQVSKDKNS
ncbi:MAG: methyl-accepting chemotaxis protein [Pseudomonadota bacterium]